MNPAKIFETGLLYHHYANTAYPLTPGSFREYRINDPAEIPAFLRQQWTAVDRLSLYLHIPFCQVRCRFCEYAVLEGEDALHEDEYVALLCREMEMYAPLLAGRKFVGYDLGGGTPTKLSVGNLRLLTDEARRLFAFEDGVVFSIETTPVIAAREPEKIRAVRELGYGRISMGIQTVSEQLLNDLGREGTTHIYEQAAANIRAAGFERFNVDLMYGFLNQSDEDFGNTLRYAMGLGPDYITLYRNRYKGTKLEGEAGGVSLFKAIRQYRLAWRILTEGGYAANPGKNTFSRLSGDYGTSDYLTTRVIYGTSYVGMGLGAQSFGQQYLAYNAGAASKKLGPYRDLVEKGQFPIQDIYRLPEDEAIAKMVSVAFYFAFVDLDAFKARFGLDFLTHFSAEMDFVLQEGLMVRVGQRLLLTERGSDYINGVIPLFYSERSKRELLALQSRQQERPEDEEQFLKAYNIAEYPRPSLTVDVVLRTHEGKVLLIRRGEHPFMNDWALPGGFVRPGETVEAAALRELVEETGLRSATLAAPGLRLCGVFSEPGRDPRGWIVSNAFIGTMDATSGGVGATEPRFGDDAMDARWFDCVLTEVDSGLRYRLELANRAGEPAVVLRALLGLAADGSIFIEENSGLAFDHAKILLAGLLAGEGRSVK